MISAPVKKAWFASSLLISAVIGLMAFTAPSKFIPMSDLLATIIAILIGVSLAISAVLSTPPKIDLNDYTTEEDKNRAQKVLNGNYTSMLDAQKILFWVYYLSLVLAVILKFLDVYFVEGSNFEFYNTTFLRAIAAAFAFVSSFALLWSATLPTLLHQVNSHKMKF